MKVSLRFSVGFNVEADEGEDSSAMMRLLEIQTARLGEVLEASLVRHLEECMPGVEFTSGEDEGEGWKG